MKVCFLGCGNIAQAIIDGLLKSGMQPSTLRALKEMSIEEIVKSQNLQIIELDNLASLDFDLIILAVKPRML